MPAHHLHTRGTIALRAGASRPFWVSAVNARLQQDLQGARGRTPTIQNLNAMRWGEGSHGDKTHLPKGRQDASCNQSAERIAHALRSLLRLIRIVDKKGVLLVVSDSHVQVQGNVCKPGQAERRLQHRSLKKAADLRDAPHLLALHGCNRTHSCPDKSVCDTRTERMYKSRRL